MGWFIRSTKKTNKRTGKAARQTQSKTKPPRDPDQTARMLRRTGMIAGALALVVGLYFGQNWLQKQVATSQAAMPQVVLVDLPVWMRPAATEEITRTVAATVDPDPLNQQSLQVAADALSQNAWIENVQRITRGYDGRVEVHATYRTPVAVIRAADGFHLVDVSATKLPGVYAFSQLEALGLPVITGVRQAPPAEGWTWMGEDARAGLALAMMIVNEPVARQVKAIDVTNYAARRDRRKPQIKLLTVLDRDSNPFNNPGVGWGRPVGEEGIYEPAAQQKMRMLRRVHRQYGSIDAGGQIVDVFADTPMIHPAPLVQYTSGRD